MTDDGNPALVDFQLHFAPPRWSWALFPVRHVLRVVQASDLYHLRKHTLWHRPELVPGGIAELNQIKPGAVRIWRVFARPIILLRRRVLVWLDVRAGRGLAISEIAPEHAARLSLERRAVDPSARLPGEAP